MAGDELVDLRLAAQFLDQILNLLLAGTLLQLWFDLIKRGGVIGRESSS